MTRHQEIEKKFDVDVDRDLEAVLATLVDHRATHKAVRTLGEPVVHELEATYVDTPDLAISRSGATLRRRTGGSDAGWHLKLRRSGDARVEVRRPLGRSVATVPPALLDEVRFVVRDRPVQPVAVLRTHRVEHPLLDGSGQVLAVLADDTVRASRVGQERDGGLAWRELEVELVTGDEDLLAGVAEALGAAGIRPSAAASKVGRVLGEPPAPAVSQPDLPRKAVGRVLLEHLRAQLADLAQQDPLARAGDVDGVHDMRVTSRRLRAALAVYRDLLDERRSEPLREELHWLGGHLGTLRDIHVVDERLSALLGQQPPELVVGPVRRRLAQEMRVREKSAAAELRAALSSERYYQLLDALDELIAAPPYTRAAGRPARKVLPRLARRAVRRVRRRLGAVDEAAGAAARDRALHELRKAVRRCRYAAESMAPAIGSDATRLGKRMHEVQDVLGEHQDNATAVARLHELAEAAQAAGESTFTFGALAAAEEHRGRASREAYPPLLRRALNHKATGWVG